MKPPMNAALRTSIRAALGVVKVHKYKNVKSDGFDSRKEAERYSVLVLRQRAKEIDGLQRQVDYLLIPTQRKADGTAERSVSYVADFVYVDAVRGRVVEDVKSPPTRKLPAYIIKRKLMLQKYGIEIQEI